jgi:hypothetical protein
MLVMLLKFEDSRTCQSQNSYGLPHTLKTAAWSQWHSQLTQHVAHQVEECTILVLLNFFTYVHQLDFKEQYVEELNEDYFGYPNQTIKSHLEHLHTNWCKVMTKECMDATIACLTHGNNLYGQWKKYLYYMNS